MKTEDALPYWIRPVKWPCLHPTAINI